MTNTHTGRTALRGARVFDGEAFHDDCIVHIDGGRIGKIGGDLPAGARVEDLDGGLLVPGFVDLQVNGGGGVMFNNEPTREALAVIVRAHRRQGTTAILPTLISDTVDVQRRGVKAVEAALANDDPGVLGVHLEGPYLDKGKRGIHRDEHFRVIDSPELDWLAGLAQRLTVMVTLAPEHTTLAYVRALAENGVIVCAGHSDAAYAIVRAAADNGLAGFTHLYNAMRALASREPGVVGAALDLDDCWCGIIVDGHHVSAPAVRLAYRAKPRGKLYLVSDAMATAGAATKSFELYGEPVRVEDGCLRNREGRLAGSAITLIDAVRIAHRDVGLPLGECLRMASLYPARFVGEAARRGLIRNAYRADLVHLDDALDVRRVWVGGIADDGPPS